MRETRIDLELAAMIVGGVFALILVLWLGGCAATPEPQWPPSVQVLGGGIEASTEGMSARLDVAIDGRTQSIEITADYTPCIRARLDIAIPPWGVAHVTALVPGSDASCGTPGIQEISITPFRDAAAIEPVAEPADPVSAAAASPAQ